MELLAVDLHLIVLEDHGLSIAYLLSCPLAAQKSSDAATCCADDPWVLERMLMCERNAVYHHATLTDEPRALMFGPELLESFATIVQDAPCVLVSAPQDLLSSPKPRQSPIPGLKIILKTHRFSPSRRSLIASDAQLGGGGGGSIG